MGYSFGVRQFSVPYTWPPRCSLGAAEVTEETWLRNWRYVDDEFRQAVSNGDAPAAWRFLSDLAEQQLARDKTAGLPRSSAGKPGQPNQCKRRTPNYQTLCARQLRRVARTAAEAERFLTPELEARLSKDLRRLSGRFQLFGSCSFSPAQLSSALCRPALPRPDLGRRKGEKVPTISSFSAACPALPLPCPHFPAVLLPMLALHFAVSLGGRSPTPTPSLFRPFPLRTGCRGELPGPRLI